MKQKKVCIAFILPVCIFFSCQFLMDESLARCASDFLPPVIEIDSPGENQLCGTTVEVHGRVTDWANSRGEAGKVSSLDYEVLPRIRKGHIPVRADNSFTLFLITEDLLETITLLFTARDWNNNETVLEYRLRKDLTSGIPSFAALPGNKQVTLTWDTVPGATHYRLYFTTDGRLPYVDEEDPANNYGICIENAESPYEHLNLSNGTAYTYLLKAYMPQGIPDSVGSARALPLSEQTLAPQVTGGYKEITLNWSAIPGCNQFVVYRSDHITGGFNPIHEIFSTTTFTDRYVQDGAWYYYKVAPYEPAKKSVIQSAAMGAVTSPLLYKEYIVNPVTTSGCVNDIALSGNYAFTASGETGVEIIDIRDPRCAFRVGRIDTPGNAQAVAAAGSFVYVADGDSGVQIIDISQPLDNWKIQTVDTPGCAYQLAVSGHFVYVAAGTSGMQIIDTSDSLHPRLIEPGVDTPGTAYSLALSGSCAYLADGEAGLQIIDISDPLHPRLIEPGVDTPGSARKVFVFGTYAYVTDWLVSQHVIDVGIPETASLIETLEDSGQIADMILYDSYIYAANGEIGVQILNPDKPTHPCWLETIHTGGKVYSLAASGSYLYAANGEAGVKIMEKCAPRDPASLTPVMTAGKAHSLTVSGSYAYVAAGAAGIQVIDVRVPETAGIVNTFAPKLPGDCQKIAIAGCYGYVACGDSGLGIITNIHKPDEADIIDILDTPGFAGDLAIAGPCACVADGIAGVQIVDISDPAGADIIKPVHVQDAAHSIAVAGSYAYVADGVFGIKIIDLRNPEEASVIRSIPLPNFEGSAKTISITGSYAYITVIINSCISCVEIMDIRDPTSATIDVKECFGGFVASGLAVAASYAYVTDANANTIIVLDVKDPLNAYKSRVLAAKAGSHGITISGGYAYLPSGNRGVQILPLAPP